MYLISISKIKVVAGRIAALFAVLSVASAAAAWGSAAPQTNRLKQQALQALRETPLVFERNQGQADPRYSFLSHADGYLLLLSPSEAVLRQTDSEDSNLRMSWVGANRRVAIAGEDELAAKSNYFVGANAAGWKTNIANYGRIRYRQLYAGIDLTYYGNHRELEYDLTIAPGVDPRKAELSFAHAESIHLDKRSGDLTLAAAGGTTRMHKPIAYQILDRGERRSVDVAYSLLPNRHVRFAIGAYDRRRELIIDPTVIYGSYFGSGPASGGTVAFNVEFLGIATDASGFIYVAGYQTQAASSPLPTTAGSFHPTCLPNPGNTQDCFDYFIAKFDPTKSGAASLVYSTYIGSSGTVPLPPTYNAGYQSDYATSHTLAVDTSGNAYVTGGTNDAAYPTTSSAFAASCTPLSGTPTQCQHVVGFLTKLNPAGTALVYSTYFGDPDSPVPFNLAVDNSGRAFAAGTDAGYGTLRVTDGVSCPLDIASNCDGNFVAAFDTTKSGPTSILYLQYITIMPFGMATDGSGNAYVYGKKENLLVPTYVTTNGYQTSDTGGSNSLLQKFSLTGAITYGSFFESTSTGSSIDMQPSGIAADAAGRAYILGFIVAASGDTNIPLLNALPTATQTAGSYPYLAAFDTTKSGAASLLYSTAVLPATLDPNNATSFIYPAGIATNGAGLVAITAQIASGIQPAVATLPAYPVVNALADSAPGSQTAVVSLFDTTKSGAAALLFSSPINGLNNYAQQVWIDSSENLYVAGDTQYDTAAGQALPVTANGYQTANATLTKYPYLLQISQSVSTPAPTVSIAAAPTSVTVGQTAMLTWSSTNATACTASAAWSGGEATSGTLTVTPALGMNTYTLTCNGVGGSQAASASVTAIATPPAPTVSITVSPTSITLGHSSTLTWSSTNATACTASGNWSGAQTVSGSETLTPQANGTDTYTLTCAGGGGSGAGTATLTVTAPPAPTVTLSISPASVALGQGATLTWTSSNAQSCTASGGWSGVEATSGSATETPTAAGSITYTLTCSAPGAANAASSVTLSVVAPGHSSGGGSLSLASLIALLLLAVFKIMRERNLTASVARAAPRRCQGEATG